MDFLRIFLTVVAVRRDIHKMLWQFCDQPLFLRQKYQIKQPISTAAATPR